MLRALHVCLRAADEETRPDRCLWSERSPPLLGAQANQKCFCARALRCRCILYLATRGRGLAAYSDVLASPQRRPGLFGSNPERTERNGDALSAAAEVEAVAPLFRFFCRLTEDLLRRRSPPKNKDRYASRTQRNTQNVCLSHRLESSVRLSGSEVQPPFILKAPLTFRTRLHAGKRDFNALWLFSHTQTQLQVTENEDFKDFWKQRIFENNVYPFL